MTKEDIETGKRLLTEDFITKNPVSNSVVPAYIQTHTRRHTQTHAVRHTHTSTRTRIQTDRHTRTHTHTHLTPQEWVKELELMLKTKKKAEIQALSNTHTDTQHCVPPHAHAHAQQCHHTHNTVYTTRTCTRTTVCHHTHTHLIPQEWVKELELMLKTKKKAEIQALSNFGFQYLTQEYLPKKIENGDWI